MPRRPFPPLDLAKWEKEPDRLDRRRIVRVAVTPEEIGLCGCWQVIGVERFSQALSKPQDPPSLELGDDASSLESKEYDHEGVLEIIRGHWAAIENRTPYRRDVTLGEDACRTSHRTGAQALAGLRNLANGAYELEREKGRTTVATLKSGCPQQTFSSAWKIRNRSSSDVIARALARQFLWERELGTNHQRPGR